MRLLADELGWTASDRVLDLGAGPAHLSLLLAPFVGEVVAMDPEPDMIEEGRRRVADAGIDKVSLVAGGSEDVSPDLGRFAAVTMSQSFHRMPDQDGVLRKLDALTDAFALVGFVNEPDYNRAWLDRKRWTRRPARSLRSRGARDTRRRRQFAGRRSPRRQRSHRAETPKDASGVSTLAQPRISILGLFSAVRSPTLPAG